MPTVMNLGVSGAAVANLIPIPTSGLLWWLDADNAGTITQSSGLVSQWNDRSGNGANATSGGSFRPTIAADGLKVGRNSLVFAGTHRMDMLGGLANQKPFTMTAVLKHTNTASYRAITGCPSSGGLEWRLSNAHKQSIVKNQVVEIGAATPVVTANVVVTLTITYSAVGALVVYMDGTSQLSTTNDQAFNGAASTVYIGDSVGEPLTATLGELIKYSRVLSGAEITQVESYLNTKWK